MESLRTRGIVLRTFKLTETSLIVVWFTRDFGKLKTVAKGARRPKSPFRGRLDLFFCDEIQWLRSRRSELHTLQETELVEPFVNIRGDVAAFRAASYLAALTDSMTPLEQAAPDLFAILREFLAVLDTGAGAPRKERDVVPLVFAFEFRLLHALGMDTPLARLDLPRGTMELLRHVQEDGLMRLARLKISPTQVAQMDALSRDLFSPYLRAWPSARDAALAGR